MEQHINYKKQVPDIINTTRTIIDNYGPRLAGSEACINAANFIKKELRKHCSIVSIDEYDQYPGSFNNIPEIFSISYMIASVLYFLGGHFIYVSTIIFALGIIFCTIQFIFVKTFFDRLFKKLPGNNVIGIIRPKGEIKQQIIICGHHDSPRICNFLERNQKFYSFRLLLPIILYNLAFILSLISSIYNICSLASSLPFIISSITIVIGFVFVLPMFFIFSPKGSPGAGDNLVASVMGIKIAEIFNESNGFLNHTRLIILSTDGEELGQKGALNYVRQHKNELKKVKTYVFNVDSIYKYEDLTLLKSDRNGTIKLSSMLLKEVKSISDQLGHSLKIKSIPFGGGGTDAAKFAEIDIDVVSLIGMSTDFIREGIFYHTSRDVIENIEPKAVEAALNIIVRFILKKDKEY